MHCVYKIQIRETYAFHLNGADTFFPKAGKHYIELNFEFSTLIVARCGGVAGMQPGI